MTAPAIPTGDLLDEYERSKSQDQSGDLLDEYQAQAARDVARLPHVAVPKAATDETRRGRPAPNPHAKRLPEPLASISDYVVEPAMDNPITTAAMTAAPVLGIPSALGAAKRVVQYGAQKAAEETLPPDVKKLAEQDPDRIPGREAATYAGMFALAPILHAAAKVTIPEVAGRVGDIVKGGAQKVKEIIGAPAELARVKEQRDLAERAANTDDLTGVANQRAYRRALPTAEQDPATAVVRFDLNNFKSVNDAHGHAVGDAALRDAAGVLQEAAGSSGRVFRSGGDEFTILAPADQAEVIRNRAEELYGVRDHGENVRTSISGAVGATEAEADAATYARKAQHKAEQGLGPREEPAPEPAGAGAGTDFLDDYHREREAAAAGAVEPDLRITDEDGVERFTDARTPGGARRPVDRVSTQGLVDELLDLDQKRADAEQRALYNYTQDENLHSTEDGRTVVSGTRKAGSRVTEQAKALKNLEDYRRMQEEIEAELKQRGVDDVWGRMQDRAAELDERAGIQEQAAGAPHDTGAHDVVDEGTGEVLFSQLPETARGRGAGRAPSPVARSLSSASASAEAPTAAGPSGNSGPVGSVATPEAAGKGRFFNRLAERVHGVSDDLRRIFAPVSRGGEARGTARVTRQRVGETKRAVEQARTALHEFARGFDRMADPDRLAFIDRMERGQPQPTPELTRAASTIRRLLDTTRDQNPRARNWEARPLHSGLLPAHLGRSREGANNHRHHHGQAAARRPQVLPQATDHPYDGRRDGPWARARHDQPDRPDAAQAARDAPLPHGPADHGRSEGQRARHLRTGDRARARRLHADR